MKQRIFIKMCGRDQNGNTLPEVPAHIQAQPYAEDGISIVFFDPDGVHKEREPIFCPNTGELIYNKTMDEIIAAHAERVADGRPYFVGTIDDMPQERVFRDAWRYDDSGKKPRIRVDLDAAKNVAKAIVTGKARAVLATLSDPLNFAPEKDKKAKAVAELVRKADFAGADALDALMGALDNVLASDALNN